MRFTEPMLMHVNAVDINGKLALGPNSTCDVSVNSLPVRVWLATLAIATASAHLR
jgi:hypothetical protein